MGIARDFPTAFAKAQAAAGVPLPDKGTVFITVTDSDKAGAFAVAQSLHECGFQIVATRGTAEAISRMGVPAQAINKIAEGSPHVLDWIERGDVHLVVNTPTGVGARTDGYEIRRAAVAHGIPCLTTLAAGISAARAIASAHRNGGVGALPVLCLQELHGMTRTPGRAASGGGAGVPLEGSAPASERAASPDGAGVA
jgi:carbamoyl-phosphate synthase large subunit